MDVFTEDDELENLSTLLVERSGSNEALVKGGLAGTGALLTLLFFTLMVLLAVICRLKHRHKQ